LSLKRNVFEIFNFKNVVTLKTGLGITQGHQKLEIFDFKNAVTLKTTLVVRQGHWKCHRSIERI